MVNDQSTERSAVVGLAALSICESLILSLQDRGLLDEHETDGLLQDVMAAHQNAASKGVDTELHEAVVDVVDKMRKGGNSTQAIGRQRSTRKQGS